MISKLYHYIEDHPKQCVGYVAAATVLVYAASRYKVALPSEYLALTGPGISTTKVAQKAVQWPFQTVTVVDMTPRTYELHISAMSSDKQDMGLPIIFSIGPDLDDESKIRYATLLSGCSDVSKVVMGFIEPEARSIAANLDIELIFQNRDAYREKVQTSVQADLKALGLRVWQSGIREIEDDKTRKDGTKYFHFLRLIKSSEAEQTARQQVANMEMKGNITVKEKERDTRIQTALYEATAVETESTSKIDIARHTAAMQVEEAKFMQQSQIAKIEAVKAAEIREVDLQKEVENRKIAQETERLRSNLMAKATVDAEVMERMAQARLYAAVKDAESILAAREAEAKGNLAIATAAATGIQLKYEAQAKGMQQLRESLGDAANLLTHEMISSGTFTKIADANANALRDMKPNITTWTTDGNGGGDTMVDITKKLIPLLSIVNKQTGIEPPSWMAKMPEKPKKY